eukprot:8264339-Pyramimonas_sp.AAC.1
MPLRLPQVARPQTAPTLGSKSSRAKTLRQSAQAEAAAKRVGIVNSLFGDCVQSESHDDAGRVE